MDSNRGQNGIQLLLAAEQEAQSIVNAARNGSCDISFVNCLLKFYIFMDVSLWGVLRIFNYFLEVELKFVVLCWICCSYISIVDCVN